jgi:hypothetical protein
MATEVLEALVGAGHCAGSNITLALSFDQRQSGAFSLGIPGDLQQPSLADRLLAPAQRAVHDLP